MRAQGGFAAARSLKRELLDEQRALWEAGQAVEPEAFLLRWPADPSDDADVASLLFEDFLQRQARGAQPTLEEYERRFPEHKDSLAQLLSRAAILRSIGAASGGGGSFLRLPDVGDCLFGFRLCSQLGRGAFARVFLAEQADLAARPVVLKMSAIEGTEPQALAQLQHTHIVPIYSVHEDARAGLRAVCMPYFGGASLAQVLQELWRRTNRPEHGRQLAAALETVRAPTAAPGHRPQASPPPTQEAGVRNQESGVKSQESVGPGHMPAAKHSLLRSGLSGKSIARDAETIRVEVEGVPNSPSAGPMLISDSAGDSQTPLAVLRELNYIRAAAWIVARLAEGLQHAHQRGVLHRDIKPSNVLLSSDGQPLLLDFNLSQRQQSDTAHATLGGTVAYMAPEHLHALVHRTPDNARKVDHRSDIYGLGMVLYEMLTGQRPFDQSGSYSALPEQIEAMALERAKKSPSLRRVRAHVPWTLESIARKCLAPDPADRYQQAEHLAEDLRRFLDHRPLRYAPELSRVERLQKWVRRHPGLTSSGSIAALATLLVVTAVAALAGVRQHLAQAQDQLQTAAARDRQQAYEQGTLKALCLINTVTDLRDHLRQGLTVCEETLGLYGVLDNDSWEEHADWRYLDQAGRRRLGEATRELLLQLAWARVHTAVGDKGALTQALALLDRAEGIKDLEPSRALWTDRALYLEKLGQKEQAEKAIKRAEQIQPAGAQDHYLLAATYARRGSAQGLAKAIAELDAALVLNPRHYWAWVQRGICHQEQGEYTLAAGDFGACIGLWPEFAWGYFNRGHVLYQSGQKAEAVADYTAALRCDPAFLEAYVNRGLARLEMGQPGPALEDFDRAVRLGHHDEALHASRGAALEALGRHKEADAAFDLARAHTAPPEVQTRIRWVYGQAVAARLPSKARAALDQVLRDEPNNPHALYGRAVLAMDQGRPAEALGFLDRACEAAPNLVAARRARALLLAREGRFEKATQDINWCLEREPKGTATLYTAACVAARIVAKLPDPETTRQALDLLRKAATHGHRLQKASEDPDLEALRPDPEFARIIKEAGGRRQRGFKPALPG